MGDERIPQYDEEPEETLDPDEGVDAFEKGQNLGEKYRDFADKRKVAKKQKPDEQDRQVGQKNEAPQGENPPAKQGQFGQPPEGANETPQKRPNGQNNEASEGVGSGTKAGQEGAERSASGAKQGLGQAGKAGEKNVAGNLAGQGAKAGAKQVGKEAVKEGALAASRAASAAAAPESLGASLAVQAGIEVASRSAGFIQKNFWLILTLTVALLFLVGGGLSYTYLAKFLFFNKLGGEEKKVLQDLREQTKEERLELQNSGDLDEIEKGVGSIVATALMTEMTKKHEKVKINYLGSQDSASDNQPYEFDVVGADKVKCTNVATGEKFKEFLIDFKDVKWKGEISQKGDNILCAVDYYPQIDSVKTGKYHSDYAIGEFRPSQSEAMIAQIIKYKQAQLIDDIIEIANSSKSDQDSALVAPDVVRVSKSFTDSIPVELSGKISAIKKTTSFNLASFPDGADNSAMHISYLE